MTTRTQSNFELLVLPHREMLYGHALSLTRNADEAEDLVQETTLRALRGFESLRSEGPLEGVAFNHFAELIYQQLPRQTPRPGAGIAGRTGKSRSVCTDRAIPGAWGRFPNGIRSGEPRRRQPARRLPCGVGTVRYTRAVVSGNLGNDGTAYWHGAFAPVAGKKPHSTRFVRMATGSTRFKQNDRCPGGNDACRASPFV